VVSSASPVPEEDGPERGAVRQASDARGSAASSGAAGGSSNRKPATRKQATPRKPAARKAPARKPVKSAASTVAPTTAAPRKVDPELHQAPIDPGATAEAEAAQQIEAKRQAKASKAAEAKAAAAARAKARAEAKARIAAEKKAKAEAQAAAEAEARAKADAQAKIDAENQAKAEAEARARAEAAAQAQAEATAQIDAAQAEAEAAAREAELEAALETRPRASVRDVDRATVIEHAKTLTFAHPIAPDPHTAQVVLSIQRLRKTFAQKVAVDNVSLDVRAGSFYGIVGPNGAGKTTTLSIVTGMLRPDSGTVFVHGVDVWRDPAKAKRSIGVLPDRLRLFDRLTGAQFLYYAGTLRGLDARTVKDRAEDLATAFGFQDALGRLVADYSAGMTKKVALAAAMIHSPRLLVLDEPFESVDPVSAATVIEILQKYVAAGGTVVLSSHGMDFIQRVCDSVAIIVHGKVLAAGTVDEVRSGDTLENRFVELAGGRKVAEGMEWLHSFSD
jgi:ABC-2 type transport system ATP-binding protein